MKKFLLWLVFALLITSSVTAQDEGLHVDASASLGTISPYVYGSNLGLYSIVPMDLMPLAQNAGIRYMRFGGADSDRQPVRTNLLDLFVLQSRMVGAEPAMTVRLLGGTPEQAAEVVRYANITKDYGIRYWHIGNEPNLFTGLKGGDVVVDTYTTDDLNQQWRAIAEAMLAVDPDIILVGPEVTQYVITAYETGGDISYIENNLGGHPRDSEGRDWLQEFLRANGDLIGIVSIHRYPYPGAGGSRAATATVEGLRENSREWDTFIPLFKQMIRDITGRDIPIGVTEINSNSSPSSGNEASLDSFYNALWFGDVLGRLIRQQVEIVASWDMQGIGQRTWGLLSGDGVRPIYYTYIMYTHFGTELLAADSTDPHVSIFASAREDGTLTLMVVNLGDDEATKTLQIDGFTPGGAAEVWLFDAEHNAEQIGSLEITDGTTITVPGRSMTLYAIPASN
jgi:alpha-L-arabinofuranosidase